MDESFQILHNMLLLKYLCTLVVHGDPINTAYTLNYAVFFKDSEEYLIGF